MSLFNSNGNYTAESVKDGSIWEGEISWDTWVEKYKPIKNHLDKYSDPEQTYGSFETYGAELDYVNEQPNENVWTMIDGDMSTIILAGKHFVNRVVYYVCEVPWTDADETVLVSVEVECECYNPEDMEGDPTCASCDGYGLRTEYL